MKNSKTPTLADGICDLRTRKIKSTFFAQINELLDWILIRDTITPITKRVLVLHESQLMMECCYLKLAYYRHGMG